MLEIHLLFKESYFLVGDKYVYLLHGGIQWLGKTFLD